MKNPHFGDEESSLNIWNTTIKFQLQLLTSTLIQHREKNTVIDSGVKAEPLLQC